MSDIPLVHDGIPVDIWSKADDIAYVEPASDRMARICHALVCERAAKDAALFEMADRVHYAEGTADANIARADEAETALSEMRAELEEAKANLASFSSHVLTTLRSKSHSDINLEIEAEAWFRDAAMWKERAEAATGELAEFRQAAESRLERARKALEPFKEIAKKEIREDENDSTKIPVRIGFVRAAARAASQDEGEER